MADKNSFKELEALYIQQRGPGAEDTKNKIEANMKFFGFVCDVLELYIPKVGNVIQSLSAFGSKNKSK